MKSKTYNIAFSGIATALAVVLLVLASYISVAEFFFYILAALLIELVLNVCGIGYGFLTFLASSILGYIFFPGNIYSLSTFYAFFGLYPIISRLSFLFKNKIAQYLFKFAYFNLVLFLAKTLIFAVLFPVLLNYNYLIIFIIGNVGFVLYDLFQTQCSAFINKHKKKFIKHE